MSILHSIEIGNMKLALSAHFACGKVKRIRDINSF